MLVRRIISAVLIVLPVIAVMVFAPHPWFTAIAFLLYTVAAWEWSGFLKNSSLPRRVALAAGYVGCLIATYFFLDDYVLLQVVFAMALLWWVLAFVWILKYPTGIPESAVVISGFLIMIPAFKSILVLRDSGEWQYLAYVFLLVWAADIGAYFVGRAIGKHKLAPAVSPGKTWEGFAGGLVLAMVAAFVAARYADLPIGPLLLLSLVGVFGSVVGDLTVSMFKRSAGVKDSGIIFPGHGGVLDRFDSFSATAPIMTGLWFLFHHIVT